MLSTRIRDKEMRNNVFAVVLLLLSILQSGTSLMAQDTIVLMNGKIIPTNKVDVLRRSIVYEGTRERKIYDGTVQTVGATVTKDKFQVCEIRYADGRVQHISDVQSNIILAGKYLRESANCESASILTAFAGGIAAILGATSIIEGSNGRVLYVCAGIAGLVSLSFYGTHISKKRTAGRILEETYLLQ